MMNNSEFLLKTYRQYWFNSEFEIIGRIKEREFGYQTMEGIYVRHISVNSRNGVKGFMYDGADSRIVLLRVFLRIP